MTRQGIELLCHQLVSQGCCPGIHAVGVHLSSLCLQAALAEKDNARVVLEEKLQHEQEKHKTYDQDSKEKRKKYDAAEKQIQVKGHDCTQLSNPEKGHVRCQQGVEGE